MLALLNRLTQDTRLLQLSTPLGADALVVECLRGEEAISQPYALTVAALSPDPGISLKTLIGQPVLLQLQTALPGQMRAFHGHVTSARAMGADGGLARYEITIGPWYAFLAAGRDSRIFQDQTVLDILDAIFSGWKEVGKLAPAWRYEVADRSVYPKRSLTCQYQESNLAFAERLMQEEGLFYYFEHDGDPASPSFGSHTMVIADHNDAFQPNPEPLIRFTQPGAVMAEDAMDRWRTALHWTVGGLALGSWDYRSLSMRPVTASSATASDAPISRDTPGAYAYTSREHGQRVADRQLEALEAGREVHTGAGTVRTLIPGTTFTLTGQAQLDAGEESDRQFVVLRVVHMAHNNLSADIASAVVKALGLGTLAKAINEEQDSSSLHAVGEAIAERPLYRNRIDAIRSKVPFRASSVDGHGVLLHPKPTVQGQQTAVVVGPQGAVIHTDRDHRIKVQFHWQRGEQSHSRLNHPNDGHSGAPGDDSAGTWVRIATPLAPVAGANWGTVAVPRIGSEVLIDFLDGNIDRPVVIGSVYNGQGAQDAQNNQVAQGAGAATGNAPAWFPGVADAYAHGAVLSGLKSQAMASSQAGSGAYSQLVFDDSPGEPRMALQRHAGPHSGTDELNLGHLRHQTDNQRLQTAGFGAELKTEHGAALRAGRGMLLSADARNGGSGQQLDTREAQSQIEQSNQLQISMADLAQKQNARLAAKGGAEPAPDQLPAIAQLAASAKAVGSTGNGSGGDSGGSGQVTAYSNPHLQLSAPAGIAAVTPVSAVLRSGTTSSLTAGQDINQVAQGNSMHLVKDGISLFSYGKASSADKPNQETGIRLHAASGKVSVQSQSDQTSITADKLITVASISKSVTVAAKQHVKLTAQGAYLQLEGGNILVHGPGTMSFKASMKELTGPADGSAGKPALPQAKDLYNEAFVLNHEKTGEPMANVPYRLESASGQILEGITDAEGRTQRLFTSKAEQVKLFLLNQD